MKKIISVITVFALALCLLMGCGSGSQDSSGNGGSAAVGSQFSNETVKFVDANGDSVYTIVRAEGLSGDAVAKAKELFTALKDNAGVSKLKNMADSAVEANSDNYEILIGHTNRPESDVALEHLRTKSQGRSRDYVIATVGKKIVINAFTESGVMDAIDYFIANYVKPTIEGGLLYVYTTEGDFSDVSINGTLLGNFSIIRPHYNSSYITQLQIEELIETVDTNYAYALEWRNDNDGDESEYEIIVGEAERQGVEYIGNSDEYSIKISGRKVYLNGGSIQATAMAVSEFGKLLEKGALTDADSVVGSHNASIGGYDKATYYTYSWGDDFEGTTIDTTKWLVIPEGRFDNPGMNSRTSIRTTDPNHVFVYDGKFHISAGYTDDKYIGGMIMTNRYMIYKYGYLEMSAILPHGTGFWTALWVDSRGHTFQIEEENGVNYGAEIDVNECFGNANVIAANVHKWPTDTGTAAGYGHTSLDGTYGNEKKFHLSDGETFNDGFHTFGFIWDENYHSFTCDGEVYFTYSNNLTEEDKDGLHVLGFIRLSAAIGFASQGQVAADDDPAWKVSNELIVDYVHIYQLQDGKQILLTQ